MGFYAEREVVVGGSVLEPFEVGGRRFADRVVPNDVVKVAVRLAERCRGSEVLAGGAFAEVPFEWCA